MTEGDSQAEIARDHDPAASVRRPDELRFYVDLYKQAVEVQMHFNDIEWRIRGLALSIATLALGAAGVASRQAERIGPVSAGSLILIVALFLWLAFYFVDRYWYHPLLKAAVDQGTRIENEIARQLPAARMTQHITAESAIHPPLTAQIMLPFASRRTKLHSDGKLVVFYRLGGVALLGTAAVLQLAACF